MITSPSFSTQRKARTSISLTPLIDVVFILLLFFMLASTFLPLSALNISSSSAGAGQQQPDIKPVIITVRDGQQWLIGSTQCSYPSTCSQEQLEKLKHQSNPVLVRAETSASVQHLVGALSHLEKLGIESIQLINSKKADHVL